LKESLEEEEEPQEQQRQQSVDENYDSDDGWSDDSVDVIYVDKRYHPLKSNSNLQQQDILL